MFEPGFYTNISFSDYLEDDAINNSGLKLFHQSPAKFKFWRDNEKPGTPTQIEGSALHCAILEPEKFESRYGKGPAPRKGSVGRTEWDKINSHAMPLTPRQWDNVRGMSKAFERTSCTVAKDLLTDGLAELSVWWDDPATGLRCKIRPDFLRDNNIVVDLKSTQAGSPQGFLREVRRWGYDLQNAWYVRGLNAAFAAAGVNRRMDAFIFVAIENFCPYEIGIYTLSENILQEANERIDEVLIKYKECLTTDIWLGYSDSIIVLGENNE